MKRSVLRVADQRAERFPEQCVLSGETTERAVRLTATQWEGARWLLCVPAFAAVVGRLPGRGRCPVALPVSPKVWKAWRRRAIVGVALLLLGVLLVITGLIRGNSQQVVVGAFASVVGAAYQTRIGLRHWVTCRYRPGNGTIIVEPTHPAFDAAAQKLFIRSLG